MFLNILHSTLTQEISFQPADGEFILLAKDPWIAVRRDDIMPIVSQKQYGKRYTAEDGKRKEQYWTASLVEDNDQKIILTVDGLFTKHWELDRYALTQGQIDRIMETYRKNRSAHFSAQNEEKPEPENGQNFDVYVKGDAAKFSFLMSDLYAVLKSAKTDEVLSFDNRVFFPVLPIRDMLRVCNKGYRWDAEIIPGSLGRFVLRVTVHDTIKTIFTVNGSESQSVLTTHKGWEKKGRELKEKRQPLKKSFAYVWNMPPHFYDSLTPETAVPAAPQPAEIAPETTQEPDPVVAVVETAVTTPEPVQPAPEPGITPAAVVETAVKPQPAKQPRKRRQTVKKSAPVPHWSDGLVNFLFRLADRLDPVVN